MPSEPRFLSRILLAHFSFLKLIANVSCMKRRAQEIGGIPTLHDIFVKETGL